MNSIRKENFKINNIILVENNEMRFDSKNKY